MSRIRRVWGRELLDSRGNPTVEAEVALESGAVGSALSPSGASTGAHEAVERRDGDARRYLGKGVLLAVNAIATEIQDALRGVDARDQEKVDQSLIELDGTKNKSRLGANATLAVSLAAARAAASDAKLPLFRYLGGAAAGLMPVPMMNLLNGGAHAPNSLTIQEFMVAPVGAASFSEGLRMGVEVYHALGRRLRARGLSTAVGDEGGFAPDLASDEQALELLVEGIALAGYEPGSDLALAIDAAASEFYELGVYRLPGAGAGAKSREGKLNPGTDEMIDYWEELARRFPLFSLEDGLDEDDWAGWRAMSRRIGSSMQIVGDDLFATRADRLARGIREKAANAVLIKVNQVGTLTETMRAIKQAKAAGMATIISHRSGETEDSFIADLAVASGTGQIKTGAPCRSDRVAKYNQLLRIEELLGDQAGYLGNRLR